MVLRDFEFKLPKQEKTYSSFIESEGREKKQPEVVKKLGAEEHVTVRPTSETKKSVQVDTSPKVIPKLSKPLNYHTQLY